MIPAPRLRKVLLVVWATAAFSTVVVLSSSAVPPLVNAIGKVLPLDAAPLAYQTYHFMRDEPASLDVSVNLYVGE